MQTNQSGSVAVEFALVAAPTVALLYALFSVGFYFLAGQMLETAVAQVARSIETGEVSPGTDGFSRALCSHLDSMIPCEQVTPIVEIIGDDIVRVSATYTFAPYRPLVAVSVFIVEPSAGTHLAN